MTYWPYGSEMGVSLWPWVCWANELSSRPLDLPVSALPPRHYDYKCAPSHTAFPHVFQGVNLGPLDCLPSTLPTESPPQHSVLHFQNPLPKKAPHHNGSNQHCLSFARLRSYFLTFSELSPAPGQDGKPSLLAWMGRKVALSCWDIQSLGTVESGHQFCLL